MLTYETLAPFMLEVAAEYRALQHTPHAHDVHRAYDALKTELWRQYQTIPFAVSFEDTDPYSSSKHMFERIATTGCLRVYRYADLPHAHPFAEVAPNGETFNSVFRAVHDALAHYPERNSFSLVGEFKAYRAHVRLMSDGNMQLAAHALMTETIGQNAQYHFGAVDREFAQQVAALLPRSLFVHSLLL